MKTKTVRVEKPYCTQVNYKFEVEKFCHKFEVVNLTEKKRVIFEHKLEMYGYYQGKQVLIVCNDEGLDVVPVISYTPLKPVYHPRCRCSII